jgi:hypothetical protein
VKVESLDKRQETMMKLYLLALLLDLADSASASASASASDSASASTASKMTTSARGAAGLMKHARRRLDDGSQESSIENYLENYSLKFLTCIPDESIEDTYGNTEYGVVIFRMCDVGTCSNTNGCNTDYAEFAVGLGTFVNAYMDDQADNMEWDDKFAVDEYAVCAQYEGENDDDGNTYYVGPACTEDGTSIKLDLFTDKYCYQKSTAVFSDIANGLTLPYSDSEGGLVSNQCTDCAGYDEYGDVELREICGELYAQTSYRCETNWNAPHYYWDHVTEIYRYGQDTLGCNFIGRLEKSDSYDPVNETMGLLFVAFLLAVSVGGTAYYAQWWKESKSGLDWSIVLLSLWIYLSTILFIFRHGIYISHIDFIFILLDSFFQYITEKGTLEKILDDEEDDDYHADPDAEYDHDEQDSQPEGNYTSPTLTVT